MKAESILLAEVLEHIDNQSYQGKTRPERVYFIMNPFNLFTIS